MAPALRVERVAVRSFDLPLARPVRVGGRVLDRRRGFLVILEDEAGRAGVGEAAPLPGLHPESPEEALAQIRRVASSLRGAALDLGAAPLAEALGAWPAVGGLLPSVRAGFEGAALALAAAAAGTDVAHLLAPRPTAAVLVNGLLEGDPVAVAAEASRLASLGYSCLKLKVGRGDPGAEAALAAQVRRAAGARVALRLDANRAWDLETAVAFARRVAALDIEYIEEPLRDAAGLPAFAARSGVPVALDETLLGRTPASPGPLGGVAALVLKPALLGFGRALAWAGAARAHGVAPVISAAFPSAAGLALEAALAAAVGAGAAHGLGTFAFLAEDLARRPIAAPHGALALDALPRGPGDLLLERTRVVA
jgi:o-succinylbenzoate synthase